MIEKGERDVEAAILAARCPVHGTKQVSRPLIICNKTQANIRGENEMNETKGGSE